MAKQTDKGVTTFEELVKTCQIQKRIFFFDGQAYSVSVYGEGGIEDEDEVGWEDPAP